MTDHYAAREVNHLSMFGDLGQAKEGEKIEIKINDEKCINRANKYTVNDDDKKQNNMDSSSNSSFTNNGFIQKMPQKLPLESKVIEQSAITANSLKNEQEELQNHLKARNTQKVENIRQNHRLRRRNYKKGQQEKLRKQNKNNFIDIDADIGEVAEWGQNNMKQYEKSDDFDEQDYNIREQSLEVNKIKQRIQDKLQKGINTNKKTTGNTLAQKAQQLKRKNQQKEQNEIKAETSQCSMLDKFKQKKQQPEDQDDPWEKINQQTQSKIQMKKKVVELSHEQVNVYYKTQFEVKYDSIGEENSNQKMSCFQMIFSCFKGSKYNPKLQARLQKLSQTSLSNETIYKQLTGKQYIRYGQHWNKIGFQGRDPKTDLRSTGILSLIQWYQFVLSYPKLAEYLMKNTMQFNFPLALTHIKVTSLFLNLLKDHTIQTETWQQCQKQYNILLLSTMSRILSDERIKQGIGELVEEKVELAKKNLQQNIKLYNLILKQHN